MGVQTRRGSGEGGPGSRSCGGRNLVRIGLVALALLAMMAAPATIWAGGVFVVLDSNPVNVDPGEPFEIGFTVRSMHGEKEPMERLTPSITLTNGETGEEVTVTATEEGPPGHYVATITLPSEGEWEWRIEPIAPGGLDAQVMSPIRVQVAAAARKPVPEAAPESGAAWAPWTAPAVVVVLAGAGAALLQRTRRAALRP